MSVNVQIRVEGVEKVRQKLDQKIREIPNYTMKGLIQAGLLIQREAQLMCPVDTGNLKASAFTVWGDRLPSPRRFRGKEAEEVRTSTLAAIAEVSTEVQLHSMRRLVGAVGVGFGAYYGLYVHEDLTASHKVGRAKFLEEAVLANHQRIVNMCEEEAKKALKR